MMDFEHREDSLLPRPLFLRRMARWASVAGVVLFGSLALGVCGYHLTEGLPWIDALLNASMILGGMGPVDPLKTNGANYSHRSMRYIAGLRSSVSPGLMIAPAAHRMLHMFHVEGRAAGANPKKPKHRTSR